jgi:glycerol-3-phosphate O-acyltransferase
VQSLAGELMTRIARVIPVLPVSLVSGVFAAAPGRALSEIELKAEVLARWRTLEEAGAEVYVPPAETRTTRSPSASGCSCRGTS